MIGHYDDKQYYILLNQILLIYKCIIVKINIYYSDISMESRIVFLSSDKELIYFIYFVKTRFMPFPPTMG